MDLITRNELAEILGVSTRTIYRYQLKGMPKYKGSITGTVRYDLKEVLEWINNN